MSAIDASRERLVADLKAALAHAEDFMNAGAAEGTERFAEARSKVESALEGLRGRFDDVEARATEAAREAAKSAERSIREHPWQAVGISAGVGLLVGLLLGRK